MVTFAGEFKDPTTDWRVGENPAGEGYIVEVARRCDCGSECCSKTIKEWTPHTSGNVFADQEDADDWIESMSERVNEQYDEWLEHEGPELARMERYEMWKREC